MIAKDENKTKAQLITELMGMRRRISEFEKNEIQHKQTEEELRDSEMRARALLEGLPVCTKIIDLDFNLLYMSPAGVEALKINDIKSFYGQPYPPKFYPESVRTNLIKHLKRCMKGEICSFECFIPGMDGSGVWYDTTFVPACDDEGRIEYIIASSIDISERKLADEGLRESEERWQFAIEGSRLGICDWNAVTNEVYYSRRWKEMLGYTEDEISNTLEEWEKRVHPDDKEGCYANLYRHFDGVAPFYESEHRMLCKDGSYKWILERGKVISWTEENTPLRVVGTHTDVTERRLERGPLQPS